MSKRTKIFLIVIVSIFLLAAIGVGSYFIYQNIVSNKTEKKINEPTIDSNSLIKFQTDEESIARAIQFNVEQADCGLIQVSKDNNFKTINDNFNILVDAGVPNGASKNVKDNLINCISDYNVKNIDLIVISHFHFDHIGALNELLNSNSFTFDNSNVLFNWDEIKYFGEKLSATSKNVLKSLNDKKINFIDNNQIATRENNNLVDFGNNNYFSVISGGSAPNDKNNQNAWSVVTKFNWNNQSILYTGDLAGSKNDANFFRNVIPSKNLNQLSSIILKSPHHGSSTEQSNNVEFLKLVNPKYVWISAGSNDKYTLPDVTALNNYLQIGVLEENIWGTLPFGKTLDEIRTQNPNMTKEQIQEIYNKWIPLNEWVINHPLANNQNQGFNNIIQYF